MERYCTTRYRMLHFKPHTKRYTPPEQQSCINKLDRKEANLATLGEVNLFNLIIGVIRLDQDNILQMLQWLTSYIRIGWADITYQNSSFIN